MEWFSVSPFRAAHAHVAIGCCADDARHRLRRLDLLRMDKARVDAYDYSVTGVVWGGPRRVFGFLSSDALEPCWISNHSAHCAQSGRPQQHRGCLRAVVCEGPPFAVAVRKAV